MSEANLVLNRPGPKPSRVPLYFYWVIDISGSMSVNGKMASLNQAIRNAIPAMRQVVADNVEARLFIRTLLFGNGAAFTEVEPTPLESFSWKDVDSQPVGTDLGAAFETLAEELTSAAFPQRGYPPVIVVVSDGGPTDDYETSLTKLLNTPWGKRAIRCGILIDDDLNGKEVLEKFIASEDVPVLFAHNPDQLAKFIAFIATTVVGTVSQPGSQVGKDDEAERVILPDMSAILDAPEEPEGWLFLE